MKQDIKAIIVSGKESSGKTETIKMIRDFLVSKLNCKSIFNLNLGKNEIASIVKTSFGKTIGFISSGDPGKLKESSVLWLEENYKLLNTCDYYICASRLFGDTIDFYLSKQKSQNGIHDFSYKNCFFVRKIKGKDDNNKIDKNEATKINNDYSSVIVSLMNMFGWFN